MAVTVWSGMLCAYLSFCSLSLALAVERALRKDPGLEFADAWRSGNFMELLQAGGSLLESMLNSSELTATVVLMNLANMYIISALLTTATFLGSLSSTETALATTRLLKYVTFKAFFMGTVLLDDPSDSLRWLAWFATVGYLRTFAYAARNRLELLATLPSSFTARHARATFLLLLILALDVFLGKLLATRLAPNSSSKLCLCMFDLMLCGVEGGKALVRYGAHVVERARLDQQEHEEELAAQRQAVREHAGQQHLQRDGGDGGTTTGGWTSWEGMAACVYTMELVVDIFVHMVTLLHYGHVWCLHGRTLYRQMLDVVLLMDMRAVAVSLLQRLRGYVRYQAANRNLHHSFPDAAAPPNTQCTICMDKLQASKQLQCGHLFHLSCLRAWLQQSGENFTCPLCRAPLFVQPGPPPRVLALIQRGLDILNGALWAPARHPTNQAAAPPAAGHLPRTDRQAASRFRPHAAAVEGSGESPVPAPGRQCVNPGRSGTCGAAGPSGIEDTAGSSGCGSDSSGAHDDGGPLYGGDLTGEDDQAARWEACALNWQAEEAELGDTGTPAALSDPFAVFVRSTAERQRQRQLPPPCAQPSTWSGGTLQTSLGQLGRQVVQQVRSSVAQDAATGGAVASAHLDSGEEVSSSRRRHRRPEVTTPVARRLPTTLTSCPGRE